MSRRSSIVIAAVATLGVAFFASYLTTEWHHHHDHHQNPEHLEGDFHQWLHDQLDLTSKQEAALHPIEKDFEKKVTSTRQQIDAASAKLAQAVKSGDPANPEIDSALKEISANQTTLKKLMLEHFFAMKKHLDPEQAEKMRQWVHDSLSSHALSRSSQ